MVHVYVLCTGSSPLNSRVEAVMLHKRRYSRDELWRLVEEAEKRMKDTEEEKLWDIVFGKYLREIFRRRGFEVLIPTARIWHDSENYRFVNVDVSDGWFFVKDENVNKGVTRGRGGCYVLLSDKK